MEEDNLTQTEKPISVIIWVLIWVLILVVIFVLKNTHTQKEN